MLRAFLDELVGVVPRQARQLHLLRAVALDLALDPQEHLGPHRLRAGEAAPHAPGDGGEQEQRQRGDDQDRGEEEQVLRPEGPGEQVELAVRQVDQERLPALAPVEPRQKIIDAEGEARPWSRAGWRRSRAPRADRRAARLAYSPSWTASASAMGMMRSGTLRGWYGVSAARGFLPAVRRATSSCDSASEGMRFGF